jgi:hypothetical protein
VYKLFLNFIIRNNNKMEERKSTTKKKKKVFRKNIYIYYFILFLKNFEPSSSSKVDAFQDEKNREIFKLK